MICSYKLNLIPKKKKKKKVIRVITPPNEQCDPPQCAPMMLRSLRGGGGTTLFGNDQPSHYSAVSLLWLMVSFEEARSLGSSPPAVDFPGRLVSMSLFY